MATLMARSGVPTWLANGSSVVVLAAGGVGLVQLCYRITIRRHPRR